VRRGADQPQRFCLLGGLPPVRLRRAASLLLGLSLLGCDSGAEAPPKSRVQAVLAEPGSTKVEPQPEPASMAPARKPRPALCAGQLEQKPASFKPRLAPTRLSLDPSRELDREPLARQKGSWTWVNFWAAWCVPCKEELPILFRWQKQLEGQVNFRFISMDDDERQLRDFLVREPAGGLTNTYWLPDGAIRKSWLEALSLDSEPELPLQLLIDPDGMLRCRVQGAVEPEDLATLQRIIRG
jgi:thiol-disulfide isomerase/thioredoxin